MQSATKRLQTTTKNKFMESKRYLSAVEGARKFLENTTENIQQNQRIQKSSWSNREKEAALSGRNKR